MRREIIFAPEAIQDFKRLPARERSILRDAIERYLRFDAEKVSRSRIKRLKGVIRPQYRLRVGDFRVFYDVTDQAVELLPLCLTKSHDLLEEAGVPR
jgi:addiction module RelE/StbE family toxin